jgi:hypothetical protein
VAVGLQGDIIKYYLCIEFRFSSTMFTYVIRSVYVSKHVDVSVRDDSWAVTPTSTSSILYRRASALLFSLFLVVPTVTGGVDSTGDAYFTRAANKHITSEVQLSLG